MTHKVKIALGSVLGATFVVAVIYVAMRPKWATATRAEVDKLIDPVLLRRPPSDPMAKARYAKLSRFMEQLKLPKSLASRRVGAASEFRTANAKLLPEIKRLVNEGPFEAPALTFLRPNDPLFPRLRSLARGIALVAAQPRLSAGARIEWIAFGEKVAFRMLEASRAVEATDFGFSSFLLVERSARELATDPKLTTRQLENLLATLPEIDSVSDPVQTIAGEFQSQLYEILPDPYILLKNPEAHLRNFAEDGDLPGTYDALLTTRQSNAACMEWVENSKLPLAQVSTPISNRLDNLADSIPIEDFYGRKGLSRWWGKQYYRYRLSHIPNSFGTAIIPLATAGTGGLLTLRAETLSWHRILQLDLRCRLFVQSMHRAPHNLSELEPIPKTLLLDPFDLRPMRYDPLRRVIWSIGNNNVDDNGANLPVKDHRPPDNTISFPRP